jgi:hypothetical protein
MGGERLDTRDPTSKLMLTILAGVATWEREIMLERQRQGIAKSKAEGYAWECLEDRLLVRCLICDVRRCVDGSAKRERESLDARIKELDAELPIGDGFWLPDQLVETLFLHRAVAEFVDVIPVTNPWRLSIDQNAKFHQRSRRRWADDEMKIAGVKAIRDLSTGLV